MASIAIGSIDAIGFEFASLLLLASAELVKVVFVDIIIVQGSFDAIAAADADVCLVEGVMLLLVPKICVTTPLAGRRWSAPTRFRFDVCPSLTVFHPNLPRGMIGIHIHVKAAETLTCSAKKTGRRSPRKDRVWFNINQHPTSNPISSSASANYYSR